MLPGVLMAVDRYEETSTSAYFICEHPDTTYLEVSYMGEVSSLCTIITRPYATGIAEKAKMNDFTIYPNPSDKLLFIKTDHPDHYSIAINSLNGQLIFSAKMEGPSQQINLSTFAKGVYFITIKSGDFVTTRKIIKL